MSRMNAGWSNSEQWTAAVPEIFKQPMTIAFGGAILAHAIFFLGLPIVASKDNQPSIADTPLVQLSPQELSLIPPDVTQSKFPAGTLLPSTTGLITPSILSPSMTPLDSGTTFTPGINFGSSSGSSSLADVYTNGSSSVINSGNASSGNILSLEAERKKLELEIARKVAAKQVEDQKIADNARSTKPTGDLPSTTPMPPSGETGKPISPAPSSTPLPAATPRPSNQEIIAANPKNYDFDSKKTGPTIGFSLQQVIGNWQTKPDSKEREIYSSLQKPPEQFQVDTPTKTLPYPVQVNKQLVAVIPDYAQKVKEGKETNGKAIVGIALNGQGKFVSEPSIIQSTGYPVLDAYAIEYVRSRMFPVTGRSGLYIMVIPIDLPIIRPAS
jgi:hypothetical protein